MYDDDYDEEDQQDFDYGDEEEYDWEPTEEQEYGYSYAQFRDANIYGGGVIEGELGMMARGLEFKNLDPTDKFTNDVSEILDSLGFEVPSSDSATIKNNISKLTFIQNKNALAYVLGYFIYKILPFDNPTLIDPELRRRQRLLEEEINVERYSEIKPTTFTDVIKYAAYWKNIILN